MANIKASIEILIYDDGTITVAKESGQEETQEHQATGTEPAGKPAKDIDAALNMARKLAEPELGVQPVKPMSMPMRGNMPPAPPAQLNTIGNWK